MGSDIGTEVFILQAQKPAPQHINIRIINFLNMAPLTPVWHILEIIEENKYLKSLKFIGNNDDKQAMEPLQLQSESQVYMYLKNFLATKAKAVQLDGSSTPKKNGKVVIIFRYSVDGRKYKLLGDLTRKAIKNFIALADEQGSPALALKEYSEEGRTTLILADSNTPNGWHCTRFVAKTSDRLKQAA